MKVLKTRVKSIRTNKLFSQAHSIIFITEHIHPHQRNIHPHGNHTSSMRTVCISNDFSHNAMECAALCDDIDLEAPLNSCSPERPSGKVTFSVLIFSSFLITVQSLYTVSQTAVL